MVLGPDFFLVPPPYQPASQTFFSLLPRPISITMSRYNPSTRPEHIDSLIQGVDRYNPHNLPLLHEYIEDQFKGEYDWDCMAALAVLKL